MDRQPTLGMHHHVHLLAWTISQGPTKLCITPSKATVNPEAFCLARVYIVDFQMKWL